MLCFVQEIAQLVEQSLSQTRGDEGRRLLAASVIRSSEIHGHTTVRSYACR
jgi:hypothetical protein